MIWSAGVLGIEIDFGLLYRVPGAVLQRKEKDGYHDYLVDSELVKNPFAEESLPPQFNCTSCCPLSVGVQHERYFQ